MVRLLRCLLFVVASVVVCRAVDVPLCDRSLCTCALPNGPIGDAVKVDDGSSLGCLCTCGRAEGEACSTDNHCVQGTSCAYPKDLQRAGYQLVCTNKCESTSCAKYQHCSLDTNYQPVCHPRSFDCDPSISSPVVSMRGNDKQTFDNECLRANANYALLVVDRSADTWNAVY